MADSAADVGDVDRRSRPSASRGSVMPKLCASSPLASAVRFKLAIVARSILGGMSASTDWTHRLGLAVPVVQAAMGGGVSGARLAGAVSRAAGLGTIGLAEPQRFEMAIREATERAPGRPICANLLLPFLRRAHVDACLRARPAAVSLFWGFHRSLVKRLKAEGIFVLHQVGSVSHARRALADGAEALILQGVEAGGHVAGNTPSLTLFEEVSRIAQGTPLIVAGGIVDASTAEIAARAGVSGIAAGTRFLLTHESSAHSEYQARLLAAESTVMTRLFGLGWSAPHRVVPNAATRRWCSTGEPRWIHWAGMALAPTRSLPLTAKAEASIVAMQRPWLPFFSPAVLAPGMDPRLADVTPLYAGTGVTRVKTLESANEIVRKLSEGFARGAS